MSGLLLVGELAPDVECGVLLVFHYLGEVAALAIIVANRCLSYAQPVVRATVAVVEPTDSAWLPRQVVGAGISAPALDVVAFNLSHLQGAI